MTVTDSIKQQLHDASAVFTKRFGRPPRFAAVAPGLVTFDL